MNLAFYFWLAAAGLAGLLCWPGMGATFVYDDLHSIANNPHLTLGNLLRVFWDPTMFSVDPEKAMYRPLLLVSYILNAPLDPFSFRLVNIALHAGSAVLVGLIALALGLRSWACVLAGLFFLVHPAGIQPMLYVSARSDGLLAFFFLWSIFWWLDEGPKWKCLAGLGCALLTKEVAVVLPLCFWALDQLGYVVMGPIRIGLHLPARTKRYGTWNTSKRLRWPVTIVFAYLCLQVFTGFIPQVYHAPAVRPGLTQFFTQVEALGFYAQALVYPAGYVLDPEFAEVPHVTARAVLCWMATLGLLFWATRAQSRIPLICLLLALLSLLVVMVAPLNLLVNYRRLYLPTAFFCLFWAWLTEYAAGGDSRWRKVLCGVFAIATLGQFVWHAATQARTWTSERALWEENTLRAPSQPRPWLYLGTVLRAEALEHEAKDAKKMHKSNPQGMRGTELYTLYHPEAAAAWAGAARALNRCTTLTDTAQVLHWKAVNNLGSLYFELNNLPKAEEHFQAAFQRLPDDPDVLTNLGNIKWMRGDFPQAAGFYEQALAQDPRHREAHSNLEQVRAVLDKTP